RGRRQHFKRAMIASLDHIIIAVRELDAAAEAYARVIGRAPSWRGRHPALGTRNVLFHCGDVYVELLAATQESTPLTAMLNEALGRRAGRFCGRGLGVDAVSTAAAAARAGGVGVAPPLPGEGVDERGMQRRTWRSAFIDPDSVRGLRLLLIQHDP